MHEWQVELSRYNEVRLAPSLVEPPHDDQSQAWARRFEKQHVAAEQRAVQAQLAAVPSTPEAFIEWFSALEQVGPGQGDPLFDYLAEAATDDEMRWFLTQEAAGEAGFDDLVALTQVKMPTRVKLEMARNYWDEMGRGRELAMHGPMLERVVSALKLRPSREDTVWESLALANLMVALAAHRHYAYQSVGALGVIELTAPGRSAKVNEGMKRLGYAGHVRQYFALHATLDVQHFAAWRDEVLRPLVESNSALARPLAEGALMRLACGARCFARYRHEFSI